MLTTTDPGTRPDTMAGKDGGYSLAFNEYCCGDRLSPLLLEGDALTVLRELPTESVDCSVTSPPYWQKREYDSGGIGLEDDYRDYVASLAEICRELHRVLKRVGSFWLNIGDSYERKALMGIPWRVAFELTDRQGWVMRNSVIWNAPLTPKCIPWVVGHDFGESTC